MKCGVTSGPGERVRPVDVGLRATRVYRNVASEKEGTML